MIPPTGASSSAYGAVAGTAGAYGAMNSAMSAMYPSMYGYEIVFIFSEGRNIN